MTYIDTSALIAFADGADSHHSLFSRLFAAPPSHVFTSGLVINEGHAWFLRRFDRTRALQFIGMVQDMTFMEVVTTGSTELEGGIGMLRRFSDQDLTLVDAVGLFMMGKRKANSCWSTDRHMRLTGARLAVDT